MTYFNDDDGPVGEEEEEFDPEARIAELEAENARLRRQLERQSKTAKTEASDAEAERAALLERTAGVSEREFWEEIDKARPAAKSPVPVSTDKPEQAAAELLSDDLTEEEFWAKAQEMGVA